MKKVITLVILTYAMSVVAVVINSMALAILCSIVLVGIMVGLKLEKMGTTKQVFRMRDWLIYQSSPDFLFYCNDLTVTLGPVMLILMWKTTENGKRWRSNYGSFNFYYRPEGIVKKKLQFHF